MRTKPRNHVDFDREAKKINVKELQEGIP